jgi:diamine N-acetyltransferase
MNDEDVPRILPAGPEHLSEIAELANLIWNAHYPGIISQSQVDYMLGQSYDIATMAHEITHESIRYDRLLLADEFVGFVSYGSASIPSELKIHKLYLHPTYQRRGFGQIVLNHVAEFARHYEYHKLILNVNKNNQQAIAAYQKNGFHIRDEVVLDIGNGFVMDDYILEKAL